MIQNNYLKWVCIKDYFIMSSYAFSRTRLTVPRYTFKSGDICNIYQRDQDFYCGHIDNLDIYTVNSDIFEHFKSLEDIRDDKLKKLGI